MIQESNFKENSNIVSMSLQTLHTSCSPAYLTGDYLSDLTAFFLGFCNPNM